MVPTKKYYIMSLLSALILVLSTQGPAVVEGGSYYGSWYIYRVSDSMTFGEYTVQYSFSSSIKAGEILSVIVDIEYLDNSNAVLDWFELREVYIGLRIDPNSTTTYNVQTDSSWTRLNKGDSYSKTFEIETTESGIFYVVIYWDQEWSNGADFQTDLGIDDYSDVISQCRLTVLPGDDTDGDGLYDPVEERLGTSPSNSDTDDDGLSDGNEINLYGTNPLNPDTDSDGLTDGEEEVT